MSLIGRARAPSAQIKANIDGNIIEWPDGAQQLFGWTADEIVGRSLTALMPSRFRGRHEAGMAAVRGTGTSELAGRELTLVGLRKSGAEFPITLIVRLHKVGGKLVIVGEVRRYETSPP